MNSPSLIFVVKVAAALRMLKALALAVSPFSVRALAVAWYSLATVSSVSSS